MIIHLMPMFNDNGDAGIGYYHSNGSRLFVEKLKGVVDTSDHRAQLKRIGEIIDEGIELELHPTAAERYKGIGLDINSWSQR